MASPTGASLLLLATLTAPLLGQRPMTYDLSIAQGGNEIGREQVAVSPGRGERSATTLAGIARYPASRPRVQLTATIEREADGGVGSAQFDLQTPEHAWRTYATRTGRRITVRRATEGRESAREYPARGPVLFLDDSLFAPWLALPALATDSVATIEVIWPRAARRGSLRVIRRGAPAGGATYRVSGAVAAEVEADSDGKVLRVILSGRGVTATAIAQ